MFCHHDFSTSTASQVAHSMQEVASTVICKQLVKAGADPNVKAVVIRVDSPGQTCLCVGSSGASCEIEL